MLSVGQQSLLGYLPAIIIQNILDKKIEIMGVLPQYYVMHTVSLFADISGFTKLSEAFSKKGRIGPEFLAFSLNRYMEQLINIIGKNGGDIFKFAGDAILVIWPETKDNDLTSSCRRAVQCALDIQSKLNDVEISPDKKLSVKIGIGVGECRILVVGGQFKRCEYLSVGEALRQACESETKATSGGQTICSEDVKNYVDKYFELEEIVEDGSNDHHHPTGSHSTEMKFYKITRYAGDKLITKSEAYLMRTRFSLEKVRQKFSELKTFLPAAISLYLAIEKESWSKEIRMLSIMFVNLKVDLSQTKNEEGIKRIQSIVKDIQRSIYRTRGALNKFLMDDKGSVMVICWGLPPMSSNDDHVRSILSALSLIDELKKYHCGALIGVTTGTCFTGVCGTIGNRREYSVLGEVVNLSARYMGEAMKFSKENNKDNVVFIDEITKNLIQNKIRCQYVSSNKLKGFSGTFNFYTPVEESNFVSSPTDPFPYIRTHRNNAKMLRCPPDEKYDDSHYYNKSMVMAGRKPIKNKFIKILEEVYLEGKKEFIVIRGVTGSGKSLFVRKSVHDFLWKHQILFENNINNENILAIADKFEKSGDNKKHFDFSSEAKLNNLKPYFIFTSFQTPTTHTKLMNGFAKIFREIYFFLLCFDKDIISNNPNSLKKINYEENIEAYCDSIGKILFKTNSIIYKKHIEEILETDLSCHFNLIKNSMINYEQMLPGDKFFDRLKSDIKTYTAICEFFTEMTKIYHKTMNKIFKTTNKNKNQTIPLILVIEDTQSIDDLSIKFIRALRDVEMKKEFKSLCVILTYQDPLLPILKSPTDKISRATDLINDDIINVEIETKERMLTDPAESSSTTVKTFLMENILDYADLKELIKKHLSDKILEQFKTNLNSIDEELLRIIISKSFKGVPLFVLDIIDNLINSKKYVQVLAGELIITSELIDMEQMLDWIEFTVPARMEKIIGSLIDSLPPKEIILLKFASVIGNLFDLQKLYDMNPFNNITKDDMYSILQSLEEKGILEFLHDLNPKELVCKFSIPFFREILYQRMLIEQKNEIHLVLARSIQYNKFKYMPHDREIKILKNHLKNSEKTLMSQMQDDIYEIMKNDKGMIHLQLMKEKLKQNELNLNNLKIFSIKNICEKLKYIDLKIDVQPEKISDIYGLSNFLETSDFQHNNHNSNEKKNNVIEQQKILQSLKSGYLEKMSEKSSLSWESRYVVVTNSKFMYFYHEKEFLENKMPLGSFYLENMYNVVILNDGQVGGKRNIFSISLTSWFKKDIQKGHRKFYFSTKNREELYEWIITLNFMSVKATYDQFASQYGQLKLPLRYQSQKNLNNKKIKEKFKGPEIIYDKNSSKDAVMRNTFRLYNNVVRKSGVYDVRNLNSLSSGGKIGSPVSRRTTISLMGKKISFNSHRTENGIEFGENFEKFNLIKNTLQSIFKLLNVFLGYIEDVIFNTDNVSYSDNKTIIIPQFLKNFEISSDLSQDEPIIPPFQLNLNILDSITTSDPRLIDNKPVLATESSDNNKREVIKFQQLNKAITFNKEEVFTLENKKEEKEKEKSTNRSHRSQITFNNNKGNTLETNEKIEFNQNTNLNLNLSKGKIIIDDHPYLSSESEKSPEKEKSFEKSFEENLITYVKKNESEEESFEENYGMTENVPLMVPISINNKDYEIVDKDKSIFSIEKEIGYFKTLPDYSDEDKEIDDEEKERNPVTTEMSPFVENEPITSRIPQHSGVNQSKFEKSSERSKHKIKEILIEDNSELDEEESFQLIKLEQNKNKEESVKNSFHKHIGNQKIELNLKNLRNGNQNLPNENRLNKFLITNRTNKVDKNTDKVTIVQIGNDYKQLEVIPNIGENNQNNENSYISQNIKSSLIDSNLKKTNNIQNIKKFINEKNTQEENTNQLIQNSHNKPDSQNTPILNIPIIKNNLINLNNPLTENKNFISPNPNLQQNLINPRNNKKIHRREQASHTVRLDKSPKTLKIEDNSKKEFELNKNAFNSNKELKDKINPKQTREKSKPKDQINFANPKTENQKPTEQLFSLFSKPIQLAIRNKKKESKSTDLFLEELYNSETPLEVINVGKIKERIREKSKNKRNYINNINFFLFNTINSNNDIIEKLNKLNKSNEEGEEDNIIGDISYNEKSQNKTIKNINNLYNNLQTNHNISKLKNQAIRKNSYNQFYEEPKYDYLSKENSDHIYNNVHVSPFFENFNKHD